ncbi:MAG: addiction module protein [Desulfovermiculus sp.]
MRINELIKEAESLPVEERVMLAESLLKSLNPPESDIDQKWAKVANKRLQELRSGVVEPVPGHEVFEKIWKRFAG